MTLSAEQVSTCIRSVFPTAIEAPRSSKCLRWYPSTRHAHLDISIDYNPIMRTMTWARCLANLAAPVESLFYEYPVPDTEGLIGWMSALHTHLVQSACKTLADFFHANCFGTCFGGKDIVMVGACVLHEIAPGRQNEHAQIIQSQCTPPCWNPHHPSGYVGQGIFSPDQEFKIEVLQTHFATVKLWMPSEVSPNQAADPTVRALIECSKTPHALLCTGTSADVKSLAWHWLIVQVLRLLVLP